MDRQRGAPLRPRRRRPARELNELTRCDCTTRNERRAKTLARRMDALDERIARLREQEELNAIRPELDGNTVMRVLDLSPGPEVGEAMRWLLELRLDEGELGQKKKPPAA